MLWSSRIRIALLFAALSGVPIWSALGQTDEGTSAAASPVIQATPESAQRTPAPTQAAATTAVATSVPTGPRNPGAAAAPSSTPRPTAPLKPSSSPTPVPSQTIAPSVSVSDPSLPAATVPSPASSVHTLLIAGAASAAGIAGGYAVARMACRSQGRRAGMEEDNNKEGGCCDEIKRLLEQKKEELGRLAVQCPEKHVLLRLLSKQIEEAKQKGIDAAQDAVLSEREKKTYHALLEQYKKIRGEAEDCAQKKARLEEIVAWLEGEYYTCIGIPVPQAKSGKVDVPSLDVPEETSDRFIPGLLPVRPFQETLHAGMCGPASLKMVLDYYGVEKSEAELAKLCGTNRNAGTNDSDIKRVAESLGFTVEIKDNSTFDDIRHWIDKQVPVIVDWFSRGRADYGDSEVADGHYSVVVGLDDDFIYLQDPEIGGLRRIAHRDFLKVWFDFPGAHITSNTDMIIRQIIAIYR